ncbi:MAG: PDZ domain-containing protein, partial [Bacteroidota bacterium]
YLLNKKSEVFKKVKIKVLSDLITVKPRAESAQKYVQTMSIAPDGNRAIVEARGEVFSLPAEKGYIQNLTRSSGFAERYPAWSPSGRYIAYWSDKSGEYELTLRDMKEGAKEKKVSNLGPGFRYNIYWSPDSKKVAYVDQTMTINILNVETSVNEAIDQDLSLFEGALRGWTPSWSPDSRWLTYSRSQDNGNGAIYLYNLDDKKLTKATEGFYSDLAPTFGPDGKYLYCVTNRSFNPVYSDMDNTWIYPNATQLGVITLRDEVESLLSAENDTVEIKEEASEKEGEDAMAKKEEKKETGEDKNVAIDIEGFERRLEVLPVPAGNMGNLAATKGKILFMRYPNSGSNGGPSKLVYYDVKDRKEKAIVEGANGYTLSANGKKVLVASRGQYGIVNVAPKQNMEKTLALKDMEMDVNPREEWKQIFNDVWRFQRDFFYDKDMHGVDWDAMREQYGALLDDCVDRADVNFLIGELIGELNASHTYRGGGDQETPESRAVGYLGVDWEKEGAYFKIKKIIRGAAWDNAVRSPMDAPGVGIKEGAYILAVNGVSMDEFQDPWDALEGLAGKTVELTFSDK